MKNKFKPFSIVGILLSILMLGCQSEAGQEDLILEEEIGAFSFGPLLDVELDELIQFEYNGEEIRIPYHVEGWGEDIVSELGLFFFVDGLPQAMRLETLEGELLRENAYMHNFALAFQERAEFYVVFTPISGEIDERVGLIAGAILMPEFMPDSIDNPIFGIFHSLTATIPAEILISSETAGNFIEYSDAYLELVPLELLTNEEVGSYVDEAFESQLTHLPNIGLLPSEGELQLDYEGVIFADDGQVTIRLFVYGGQEVTNRITLFINHQPVQVNGVDFIEVEMEVGQMAVIDLILDVDELSHFSSLYAIMMTTGEDYHVQDIFKTRTLLLVSE